MMSLSIDVERRTSLDSLAKLVGGEIVGALALSRQSRKAVEAAHLTLKTTANDFLSSLARGTAEEWSSCALVDYSAAALAADGEVMSISRSDVPMFDSVVRGFDDLSNLPQMDPNGTFFRNLRIAATRVEAGEVDAVFLFSFRCDFTNARSKKRVRMVFKSGALEVPKASAEATVARRVTAVLIDDTLFFRDRREFQELFGLLEEMKEQAAETFKSVTRGLRIEGIDEMMKAVTGTTVMLGKMASIQAKLDAFPIYKKALTMPKLVAFIKKHPACQVEIAGEGSYARLVFRNDPQHRFKILNLLDDDLLKSELTGLQYEANSKTTAAAG